MFTWWFKVTFLGWLRDPFKGLSEPAGVWRVSLAALEYEFVYHEVFIACKSCPPWIYFAQASRTALCTYGVFSASESCVHTHLASHYILGHVEVNRNAHTDNYISLSIWSKIQEVFSSRELTHPTLGKGKSLIHSLLPLDQIHPFRTELQKDATLDKNQTDSFSWFVSRLVCRASKSIVF